MQAHRGFESHPVRHPTPSASGGRPRSGLTTEGGRRRRASRSSTLERREAGARPVVRILSQGEQWRRLRRFYKRSQTSRRGSRRRQGDVYACPPAAHPLVIHRGGRPTHSSGTRALLQIWFGQGVREKAILAVGRPASGGRPRSGPLYAPLIRTGAPRRRVGRQLPESARFLQAGPDQNLYADLMPTGCYVYIVCQATCGGSPQIGR